MKVIFFQLHEAFLQMMRLMSNSTSTESRWTQQKKYALNVYFGNIESFWIAKLFLFQLKEYANFLFLFVSVSSVIYYEVKWCAPLSLKSNMTNNHFPIRSIISIHNTHWQLSYLKCIVIVCCNVDGRDQCNNNY